MKDSGQQDILPTLAGSTIQGSVHAENLIAASSPQDGTMNKIDAKLHVNDRSKSIYRHIHCKDHFHFHHGKANDSSERVQKTYRDQMIHQGEANLVK